MKDTSEVHVIFNTFDFRGRNTMRSGVLWLCLFLSCNIMYAQELRSLDYYKGIAIERDPTLSENKNLANFNLLQNNILTAQYKKPQLNVSADYLFAPFFSNKGKFISVTQNPEQDAYGYDVNITNGGLYSTQFNADFPLLTGKFTNIFRNQFTVQNDILKFKSNQVINELSKIITEQYIAAFMLQQQINYQRKIIKMVGEGKQVAEQLVLKGLMQENDFLLLEIEIKQREYDLQQMRIELSSAFTQLNTTCQINDTSVYLLEEPHLKQSQLKTQFAYSIKYQLDSAEISSQQEVFNTKYRAKLNAFGNAGLNATTTNDIYHYTGISAGLHFILPIYDGGQKKMVTEQNSLLLKNLDLYKKQSELYVANNLALMQQQINMTTESLNLLNSQLSTQETLLEIIKSKVVKGQISVTDYLVALENYVTANHNKIQAQTNLLLLINQYNYINW